MTDLAERERSAATGDPVAGQPIGVTRIRPSAGRWSLRLWDVWEARELLHFLCWRIIKVRYKQTILGAGWAIIQPLCTMLLFSLIFGRLVRVPSDGMPYPAFVYCGLLPWQLFAQCLAESSASLVNNEHLITKVYFPRLVIPLAPVLISLLDFACAGVVLVGLLAYYRIALSLRVLCLPLLVLLALAVALGVGLWLSALYVRYRDVRYVVPFLTQLWLFATPIAYPASLVPEVWRPILGLNPLAGVVEGFRWALLGTGANVGTLLAVSTLTATVFLASGLLYFTRMERTLADVL